jgi:hypothetical protein
MHGDMSVQLGSVGNSTRATWLTELSEGVDGIKIRLELTGRTSPGPLVNYLQASFLVVHTVLTAFTRRQTRTVTPVSLVPRRKGISQSTPRPGRPNVAVYLIGTSARKKLIARAQDARLWLLPLPYRCRHPDTYSSIY